MRIKRVKIDHDVKPYNSSVVVKPQQSPEYKSKPPKLDNDRALAKFEDDDNLVVGDIVALNGDLDDLVGAISTKGNYPARRLQKVLKTLHDYDGPAPAPSTSVQVSDELSEAEKARRRKLPPGHAEVPEFEDFVVERYFVGGEWHTPDLGAGRKHTELYKETKLYEWLTGQVFTKGRFTQEEDVQILRNYHEYMTLNCGLNRDDLFGKRVTAEGTRSIRRRIPVDFKNALAQGISRPPKMVFDHAKVLIYANNKANTFSTAEEDDLLLRLVDEHGRQWSRIADVMGRTHRYVFARYNRLAQLNSKDKFTDEENKIFEDLLCEQLGVASPTELARFDACDIDFVKLETRARSLGVKRYQVQLRDRWPAIYSKYAFPVNTRRRYYKKLAMTAYYLRGVADCIISHQFGTCMTLQQWRTVAQETAQLCPVGRLDSFYLRTRYYRTVLRTLGFVDHSSIPAFETARQMLDVLPDHPVNTEKLKRDLKRRICEAEQSESKAKTAKSAEFVHEDSDGEYVAYNVLPLKGQSKTNHFAEKPGTAPSEQLEAVAAARRIKSAGLEVIDKQNWKAHVAGHTSLSRKTYRSLEKTVLSNSKYLDAPAWKRAKKFIKRCASTSPEGSTRKRED